MNEGDNGCICGVFCKDCNASTDAIENREEAIKAWNTRSNELKELDVDVVYDVITRWQTTIERDQGHSIKVLQSERKQLARLIVSQFCPRKLSEEEIRRIASDNGLYTMKTEPFKWMKSWLTAYSKENDKENDIDVNKIMNWIYEQPMCAN